MILVLVFVAMISLIMKQHGHIKSINPFTYSKEIRYETRNINDPLLEETIGIRFTHPTIEHPPR